MNEILNLDALERRFVFAPIVEIEGQTIGIPGDCSQIGAAVDGPRLKGDGFDGLKGV